MFALEGKLLIRERYALGFQGNTFSLNIECSKQGTSVPVILEAEFETEAQARAAIPPGFCTEEVSNNPLFEAVQFAGFSLPAI